MKSDLDHVLFTCAYSLCLVDAWIFGYSTFAAIPFAGAMSLALRICAAVLVLMKLVLDRHYSLGSLIGLALLGTVFLAVYVKSGYSHIFYLMIVCLGMRGVDEETIISLDFWLRIMLFILITLCALIGLIENYVTYRTNSAVLRYSIGFNHPNTAASLVLSLILEEAWINRRHATPAYTVVVWGLTAVTYMVTANRTAVLIMAVFPIALFLCQNRTANIRKTMENRSVLAWSYPIAAVFSYAAMTLSRSSAFFRLIDHALSNRFYNVHVVYDSYGVPLLGQKVELVSVKTARLTNSSIALLDVAYLRLLIQAGPVVLVLLGFIYGKVMNKTRENGDHLLALILCIYILFGLCESGFNNVFMNFTILFAAKTLFESEKCTEEAD